jgi:hypothetical protein
MVKQTIPVDSESDGEEIPVRACIIFLASLNITICRMILMGMTKTSAQVSEWSIPPLAMRIIVGVAILQKCIYL